MAFSKSWTSLCALVHVFYMDLSVTTICQSIKPFLLNNEIEHASLMTQRIKNSDVKGSGNKYNALSPT